MLAKAGRAQLKGVLKDQRTIAGIGNAYSDEILHAAKLSPFKPSNSLTDAELGTSSQRSRASSTDAIAARRRAGRQGSQGREEVRLAGARA